MKPTKRKAFNFLRSYFDVLNELKDDADKLDFLLSVINKQFLNEEPEKLNFIVNLCYQSQRHSIESSVKGWIRVSNTDTYGNSLTNPSTNPSTDLGTNPSTNPKEVEVEGKVEVEEKEENNGVFEAEIIEYSFTDFWEVYPNKTNKKLAEVKFNKLTKEQKDLVEYHLPLFVANKPFKEYNYPHATTYLNQDRYKDEITTNFKTQENERLKQISTMLRSDGSAKYL
jgi:hypothetical protein